MKRALHNRSGEIFNLSYLKIISIVFIISLSMGTKLNAEVRIYTKVSSHVFSVSKNSSVDIFLKQENRFRESGLVLNKIFIGLKSKIRPWLSTQIYYANKDMNYSSHINKHMLVGDIILSTRLGPFKIKERAGNEWHVTDAFYRYRNYLELSVKTPVRQLSFWSSEEWRFDSDQKRINVNDVRLGIGDVIRKNLSVRVFFDLESKRRNSVCWHDKPFLGLALAALVS